MIIKLFLITFFGATLLFITAFTRTSENLKVTLSHGGILVGRYLASHSGRGIRAFMGIPYAQPPVHDLRFKPPVPALPWRGEKQVTSDSPICIQRDPFRRDMEIEGSEDCLYINVYVPETKKDLKSLPVMIFFHGGGWICGSGISSFYGPDFLMEHDVIYVSGNFRLGILGFLSTETADCPGNNGLKDQVEIMRWVQKNIASFGGDPNRVTIFGESAGGASVTYHMMSKLSKGLFQQGISQSGTNLSPWAQPAHKGVAAKKATKLAELMNCKSNDSHNWAAIIKCLQAKPAIDIAAALYDFFEWDYDPLVPFPPVVEPDIPGAFIIEHPLDVHIPHGLSIPWITGITTEEGALKTAPLLNTPKALDEIKQKLYEVLPISLNYDHHKKEIQNQITRKIEEFYFNGHERNWNVNNHRNLTNLYTDSWFLAGVDTYLRMRFDNNNKKAIGPTYVYLFDHKGAASFSEIFKGGRENYYGVCHAEELQYLFPIGKHLFISAVPTKRDLEVRKTLLELWVNFAKFGNPTPKGLGLGKWKLTDSYPINFVRIGSQEEANWNLMSVGDNFFQERANFWRDIKAHNRVKVDKDEL